jgi:hypothetical protein
MRRILFQETDFGTLPNPPAGFKYIGFDGPNFTEKDNTGATTPAGGGGGGYVDITYSEIIYAIDESELKPGSYYRITDFRTCYDQPDFNYQGSQITEGNYKTSATHSIIVFATSVDTLSVDAYQSDYPNDTIKYDVSWNQTEITGGTAYGRITERIDEYGNRTDYDHRNILFKRYTQYYFSWEDYTLGDVQISSSGTVSGTNSNFTSLSTGDVVIVPNYSNLFYKIVSIYSDTIMTVTGSFIPETYPGLKLYTANSNGYVSHYSDNTDPSDYVENYTFHEIDAYNNYFGNYCKQAWIYEELSFILPNNVMKGGDCNNNKFGDMCYNNTFDDDCTNNRIGDWFYNNGTNDDFDKNIIGNYFNNNIINANFNYNRIGEDFEDNTIINNSFYRNNIGNDFNNNFIMSDNDFQNNEIGNQFNNNKVFESLYKNDIGNGFNNNYIKYEFYGNLIGNGFHNNDIFLSFYDNQIGEYFESNYIYGDFYRNVIGNSFNNNNHIGHDFHGNHIGNGLNDNYIGDYFLNNKIGEYFESNYIYNNFKDNSIGNDFSNNTLGDIQYFNWANTNIENLTARDYNSFYNALDQNIDNVILGKELIMHFTRNSGTVINSGQLIIGETYEITNYLGTDDFTNVADIQSGNINTNGCVFVATGSTVSNWSSQSELTELTSYDEYHKVKFTQWTQYNNGGGFSYERTKVYPTGGPTIYFTKINYQPKVDVIIEDRLEITRENNQAIYNAAVDNGWSNNTPYGTQWNSIYTQTDFSFENNDIQDKFKGNYILEGFYSNSIGYGFSNNELSTDFSSNITATYVYDNNFYGSAYLNEIGDFFEGNNIGDEFNSNKVGANFYSNNIAYGFSNNQIGKGFYNNEIEEGFGFGGGNSRNNIIGDYFQNNTIGEYFYNNKVASYFENNTVGYYFQRNNIDTEIYGENFIVNYGNILALTYTSSGTTSTDNYYTVSGNTNGHGTNSTFGVTVSGGTISSFSLINDGNQYVVGDTITIPGNIIGGQIGVISSFDASNGLGKNGTDGSYFDVTVTGGSGSNATFNIDVTSGTVSNISLSNGGGSYLIGNTLSVSGSQFGGTNSVDDFIITVNSLYSDNINITVTAVSATPSVYDSYNCQIFERKGGNRRLSFYDENDILTIKNINE